ncbi:MAG: TRAP transporter small permease [Ectothiorhodospiraceae bacterium]|nr:TRAP transporter small permease [Ectothiorhodospiraceae bacterium]
MIRYIDKLYGAFGAFKLLALLFCGLSIFAMMGLIGADVFSRNVLRASLPGAYEIVTNYLMPGAALSVVFYAFAAGACPRIPLVFDKLPAVLQKPMYMAVLLFELVLMGLVAYYTYRYAVTGTQAGHFFTAAGSTFPKYPIYYLVPFGFLGMALEIIFVLLKNLLCTGVWIGYHRSQEELVARERAVV